MFNIAKAGNEIDRLVKDNPELLIDVIQYFNLKAVRKNDFIYCNCPVCGSENTNFRIANFRRENASPFWTCWKSTTTGETPHHRKYSNSLLGFVRGHTKRDPESLYIEILKAIRMLNKEGCKVNYQTQLLHSLENKIISLEKAPEREWRAFCQQVKDKVAYREAMEKKGLTVA